MKRPLTPEILREMLEKKALVHAGKDASPEFRRFVASVMGQCVAGSSKKRHTVLKYLTGEASTNSVSGAMIYALRDWLDPDETYRPSAMALSEAKSVHGAALIEEGQTSMFAQEELHNHEGGEQVNDYPYG